MNRGKCTGQACMRTYISVHVSIGAGDTFSFQRVKMTEEIAINRLTATEKFKVLCIAYSFVAEMKRSDYVSFGVAIIRLHCLGY